MLDWLPVEQEFRTKLKVLLDIPSPSERLERLASLASHRLDLLETIQLDRMLSDIRDETPGFTRARVAILSSCTVDHLAPGIRVAGLRRGLLLDVYIAGFAQYRQEVLDPSSALYRFAPEFVVFSLSSREVVENIPAAAADEDVLDSIERHIGEIRGLWRRLRENLKTVIVQQTFLNVGDPVFGSFDRCVAASPSQIVASLNDSLATASASDGVLLLDAARESERGGRNLWFDRARWFQAKQEIAPRAASLYGELLARVVAAQRGLSRKCLVLDLDNTLWHGVVGDDGIEGIVLGQGSAVGEAHLCLQRYAKQLLSRGIILAVCSKNDPLIAEEVFEKHPEMILERSDFAAFAVNWKDKAENLQAIAKQLNIGIDSLVFVDDNPVERSRVRQALPRVAVPELPDDVADYVGCLSEAGYFESIGFTQEDRQRKAQYQANAAREALQESVENIDGFLTDLEMILDFGPFTSVDIARVTQLINKTNQFHPTSRRYAADEVARFASAPNCLTLQFRLADRFGDNGLVSAMILVPDAAQPKVLVIDTWVMSCRVFGRQLEAAAMNVAVETASRRGIRGILGEYIPTTKNTVVSDLFQRLGFSPVTPPAASDGKKQWYVSLDEYVPKESRITRKAC
jgi:FkbH-like protein